jgi:hypothetical protein
MSIYNTINHIPYTYLIGWSKLNKWYYGVRFAKKCHPSDLWIKYFTSSKQVKHFRKIHGEPDIIDIRKTFSSVEAAILWEEKVLRKVKVLKDDKWLNQNITGAIRGVFHTNYVRTPEIKQKIGASRKGKFNAKDTKTGKMIGLVSADDPRRFTGEIVGANKGIVTKAKGKPSKTRGIKKTAEHNQKNSLAQKQKILEEIQKIQNSGASGRKSGPIIQQLQNKLKDLDNNTKTY